MKKMLIAATVCALFLQCGIAHGTTIRPYSAQIKSIGMSKMYIMGYPPFLQSTSPTWIFRARDGAALKIGFEYGTINRPSTTALVELYIQSLSKIPNQQVSVFIHWPNHSDLKTSYGTASLQYGLWNFAFNFNPGTTLSAGFGNIEVVDQSINYRGQKKLLLVGKAYFHMDKQGPKGGSFY